MSHAGGHIQSSTTAIIPTISIADLNNPDAIYLAGVAYNEQTMASYFATVAPMADTIEQLTRQGKPIVSCCAATFILAQLGLLNGRQATTAWWLSKQFQKMFPNTQLKMDSAVVQDGNIITGGATSSFLSCCVKLLDLLHGETFAIQMAKIALVDPNRTSQMPYMSLQVLQRHNDDLIWQIQKWMHQHLAKSIGLDDIADKFAITKRTLIRRFKSAVNDTPANYLKKLRVEEAKRLLESSSYTLEKIVNQIGYEDVSSFRRLFSELTLLSPTAYREKFNVYYSKTGSPYNRI